MPTLIAYKSALDTEILFEKNLVPEKNLSKAIYACKELHGIKVCASVNDTPVFPEDWHLFELFDNDEIRLYPEMGKDVLPWAGAVIGAIIGFYAGGPVGAFRGAVIGYSLGSMADSLLFPPSFPQIPVAGEDGSQDPDYSWSGSMLITQPDGPVGVLYGQYAISGTLIMQYIAEDINANNEKANYLYMLIALCEGEIEGIMKEDESGVISSNSDYPWIKINGEFLSRYQETFYDYRLGTQYQSVMRGWHNTSTFYSDNQKIIKGTPVTYTTTGTDIEQFEVHLMVPNLYVQDSQGNIQENSIQYKLEYKISGDPSWIDGGTHTIVGKSKTAIYYNHKIPFHSYDSGNLCSGGTPSASSILTNLNPPPIPSYAFDQKITAVDGWCSGYGLPQWIKYDFGSGNEQIITKYSLKNVKYSDSKQAQALANQAGGAFNYLYARNFPRAFLFQGSTNNSDWITLDTQSGIDDPGSSQVFKASFSNTTAYRYYRFYITESNNLANTAQIGEIELSSIVDQGDSIEKEQYEIKVSRITPEFTSFKKGGDLYLIGVTETVYENIAYRNTAVLGLKLAATEQLQGTTPDVRVLLRGKKVSVPKLTIAAAEQTYDDCYWNDANTEYRRISDDEPCTDGGTLATQWSKHPIWCSRDFILNKRFGIGEYIDSDHFDDSTARTEAKYCWELVDDLAGGTDHRFEMDLSLTRFTSAQESLRLLSQNFRGCFLPSGKSYKPVIDRAKDSVQLFNSSNMYPKSLKTTWIKQSQTANLIELQYANPDREYAVETREVPDEEEWTDSKPLRKKTINARGTCRISQLFRDGKYSLNCEKECDQTIEYDADRDTIKCEPGDPIRFQNDLFAWGVGGRIVSATSSSVTINIDATYSASYQVRVRLPNGTLEAKTVTSITNNNRTLNISGTFTQTPLKDSIWTYGAVSVDSKPFKVIAITKSEGQKCKLICLTESSNKYLDTDGVSIPEPTYSSLPNPSAPPLNIVDLTLTEMTNQPGFYISFSIPTDTNWHHVDFHVSLDYINWSALRTSVKGSGDIEVVDLKPGITYYIKAISYNRVGMANLSPVTDSILVSWNSFKPPNVSGLRLDGESSLGTTEFTTRDPKFVWKKTSLTSGAGNLPAGEEPLGAGQYYDDSNYKYVVEIRIAGIRKRKEILSDNFYTYTYEKNVLDNGTASISFTIWVWGFNEVANLKSVDPSKLRVSNPAPSAVSGLSAMSLMRGIKFFWQRNTEVDFDHYSYRTKGLTGFLPYTVYTGSFSVGDSIVQWDDDGTVLATATVDSVGVDGIYVSGITGTFQSGKIFGVASYGSELITAQNDRDFSSANIGNWDKQTDGTGTLLYEGTDPGAEKVGAITAVGDESYIYGRLNADDYTSPSNGSFYQLTAACYVPDGNTLKTAHVALDNYTGILPTNQLNQALSGDTWTTLTLCALFSADVTGNITVGFNSAPTAGDILYYDDVSFKKITNAALASGEVTFDDWSDWIDITNTEVMRFLNQLERNSHGNEIEISIQVKAIDSFGSESSVSTISEVTTSLYISPDDIKSELFANLQITDSDSNPSGTLSELYDNTIDSGGVSYDLIGTDKWIQYSFPIPSIIDRVATWTDNSDAQVYVGYTIDGSTWEYLKAEADHTLDSDGKLIDASNQADCQANYWSLSTGKNVAIFPDGLVVSQIRLYLTGTFTSTIYELIFIRQVIAEQIVADQLSAITAALGSVVITTGEGITVDVGGDVSLLSETGGNTAFLNLVGDSRIYSFGTDFDTDYLFLSPDTADTGVLAIGYEAGGDPAGGTAKKAFTYVQINSDVQTAILAGDYTSFLVRFNSIIVNTAADGDFHPLYDGNTNFGTTTLCWKTGHFNQLLLQEGGAVGNVSYFGQLYTKSDNLLYFRDGDGTEHVVAFV